MQALPLAADLGDVSNLALAILTVPILIINTLLVVLTRKSAAAAAVAAEAARVQAEVARTQTEIAERQTGIAARSVEADTAPLLVEAPLDMGRETSVRFVGGPQVAHEGAVVVVASEREGRSEGRLSMPIRNVGRGAARIMRASLSMSYRGAFMPGPGPHQITRNVVAAGESARINWEFTREDAGLFPWDAWASAVWNETTFVVEVSYADIGGGQQTVTRFELERDPRQPYAEVRRAEVASGDSAHVHASD